MSENGGRVAFLAGVRGLRTAFLDQRPLDYGPEWVVGWPLAMSGDGRTVAVPLTNVKTRRSCAVLDGRRGEEFESVGALALSRDGKTLAYRAREGNDSFIVVRDRKGPALEQAVDPAVSDDGRTVVYAAAREGRWRLVKGESEQPLPGKPSAVFVSPDGGSSAYVVLEPAVGGGSAARAVVNGARGEAFGLVGRVVFAPGGRAFAYAADEGPKQYIVVGGARSESPGRVTDPVFSPDGKRVGYGARIGRELWWKNVGKN